MCGQSANRDGETGKATQKHHPPQPGRSVFDGKGAAQSGHGPVAPHDESDAAGVHKGDFFKIKDQLLGAGAFGHFVHGFPDGSGGVVIHLAGEVGDEEIGLGGKGDGHGDPPSELRDRTSGLRRIE